jgi:hypothetical protein
MGDKDGIAVTSGDLEGEKCISVEERKMSDEVKAEIYFLKRGPTYST